MKKPGTSGFALMLALSLGLAACSSPTSVGQSSPIGSSGATPTLATKQTPTTLPMLTPTGGLPPTTVPLPGKTATITAVDLNALHTACPNFNAQFGSTFGHYGDLYFVNPYTSSYPGADLQLPANLPAKPFQFDTYHPQPEVSVNPSHQIDYGIGLVNCSKTQSYTISGFAVKVVAYTAPPATLNVWDHCSGTLDATHRPLGGAGCGGAHPITDMLTITVPTVPAAGTVYRPTLENFCGQIKDFCGPAPHGFPIHGPLPVTLNPGAAWQELGVNFASDPPKGSYQIAVGLIIGDTVIYSQPAPPYLFAPVTRTWSGIKCNDPAMNQQITAGSGQFICPTS